MRALVDVVCDGLFSKVLGALGSKLVLVHVAFVPLPRKDLFGVALIVGAKEKRCSHFLSLLDLSLCPRTKVLC